MKYRTRESCIKELRRKLGPWNGDTEWLLRILDELDKENPKFKPRVEAFRRFWGLTGKLPESSREIAEDYGVGNQAIYDYCTTTLVRLYQSKWWGKEFEHLRDP